MTIIKTDRLYLRPLTALDASQTYADWLNDASINSYLETRHTVHTVASCKEFIESCNSNEAEQLFGVFLKEYDTHIGNAKLGAIHKEYSRAQLSLFIGDKSQWGKGFATEIVCALTKFGFAELGLDRIEAGCYEDNLASLRVFLKVGYTLEGFLRSHFVHQGRRTGCFWLAILKDEFS